MHRRYVSMDCEGARLSATRRTGTRTFILEQMQEGRHHDSRHSKVDPSQQLLSRVRMPLLPTRVSRIGVGTYGTAPGDPPGPGASELSR